MITNEEFYFNIGSLSIPYYVTENKKAKCIKLVMGTDGLRVTKPLRTKLDEVEKVLKIKSNWIYKNYVKLQSVKAEECDREWKTGERILFKGDECNIAIYTYNNKKVFIDFDGKLFDIYVNENIEENERKAAIEDALKKWYIEAANKAFKERLDYFCRIIGFHYNTMRVKEQKTRWGSCSKKGNLNFNWKLIMSPQWVTDYVIIHEVCHLRYLNHSKEYWNMVALHMPEHKKARQWLKKNGMKLGL
ncbi:MAG: M48 family metallopeptidase [Ignavibacteriales bacterium]